MKKQLFYSVAMLTVMTSSAFAVNCDKMISKKRDKGIATFDQLSPRAQKGILKCIKTAGDDAETELLADFYPEKYAHLKDEIKEKKKKKARLVTKEDFENHEDYIVMEFSEEDLEDYFPDKIWSQRVFGFNFGDNIGGLQATCRNNPGNARCHKEDISDFDAICEYLELDKAVEVVSSSELIQDRAKMDEGIILDESFFGSERFEKLDPSKELRSSAVTSIKSISCVGKADDEVVARYSKIKLANLFEKGINVETDHEEVNDRIIDQSRREGKSRVEFEFQFNSNMPGSSFHKTFKSSNK